MVSWKRRALEAEAELRGDKTERLKEALFKAQDDYIRAHSDSALKSAARREIHAEAALRKHLDIPGSARWQPPNRYWPQINDWSY